MILLHAVHFALRQDLDSLCKFGFIFRYLFSSYSVRDRTQEADVIWLEVLKLIWLNIGQITGWLMESGCSHLSGGPLDESRTHVRVRGNQHTLNPIVFLERAHKLAVAQGSAVTSLGDVWHHSIWSVRMTAGLILFPIYGSNLVVRPPAMH